MNHQQLKHHPPSLNHQLTITYKTTIKLPISHQSTIIETEHLPSLNHPFSPPMKHQLTAINQQFPSWHHLPTTGPPHPPGDVTPPMAITTHGDPPGAPRTSLRALYVLIDARHGFKWTDHEWLTELGSAGPMKQAPQPLGPWAPGKLVEVEDTSGL